MSSQPTLPLEGILVLDMAMFLAGPYAALRLQDLGARVIKIERPDGGDLCRRIYKADDDDTDSIPFHTFNRGKESIALDLKNAVDREVMFQLIEQADVLIQNYRPGVAERLGLGYQDVRKLNPRLVYASISGYGTDGPWTQLPGQDLLAQARSGLLWLTGNAEDAPTPTGLAVGDVLTGANTVQGILAALVRRGVSGAGQLVETSLLEGLIDLQLEMLTVFLNNGRQQPQRAKIGNANAYASAPYGVYQTTDGYLALAMTPLARLAALLDLSSLQPYLADPDSPLKNRDAITWLIADRLAQQSADHWLSILQPADVWCARVLGWPELLQSEQCQRLDMLQVIEGANQVRLETTCAPLRLNGQRPHCSAAAPPLGAHSEAIRAEFCRSKPAA